MIDARTILQLRWDDRYPSSGQQYLDLTKGYVAAILKMAPEFTRVELFDHSLEHKDDEARRLLALDLSNYDDLAIACLPEASASRGHREFTRDGIPYMFYSATITFYNSASLPCHPGLLVDFRLSGNDGYSTVMVYFFQSHSDVAFVSAFHRMSIEYWMPDGAHCGPIKTMKALKSEHPVEVAVNWCTYSSSGYYGIDIPGFVSQSDIAEGVNLEVQDDAPFAESPSGVAKIRVLFELLNKRPPR